MRFGPSNIRNVPTPLFRLKSLCFILRHFKFIVQRGNMTDDFLLTCICFSHALYLILQAFIGVYMNWSKRYIEHNPREYRHTLKLSLISTQNCIKTEINLTRFNPIYLINYNIRWKSLIYRYHVCRQNYDINFSHIAFR